jgi:hypothetical protein
MKQTDFVAKAIALLGALSVAAMDCALAPINARSLLAGVKQWASCLWLPFIAAWREF